MNDSSFRDRSLRHQQEQNWLNEYEGKFSEAFSALLAFASKATLNQQHLGKAGVIKEEDGLQDRGYCLNPVHAIWQYGVIVQETCTDIGNSLLFQKPKPVLILGCANQDTNLCGWVPLRNSIWASASIGLLAIILVTLTIVFVAYWNNHLASTPSCLLAQKTAVEPIPQRSVECFSSNRLAVHPTEYIRPSLQSSIVTEKEEFSTRGTDSKIREILRDCRGRFCKRPQNLKKGSELKTWTTDNPSGFHISNVGEGKIYEGLQSTKWQDKSSDTCTDSKPFSRFFAEFYEGPEE